MLAEIFEFFFIENNVIEMFVWFSIIYYFKIKFDFIGLPKFSLKKTKQHIIYLSSGDYRILCYFND